LEMSGSATTFTRSLGGSGPDSVTWTGSGGFVPSGSALVFGSANATASTTFINSIDFGGENRTITVKDSATLSGVLSNGGLIKDGPGRLDLHETNTYAGPTIISAGTLYYIGPGAIPSSSDVTVNGNLRFSVSGSANLKCLNGTGAVAFGGEISSDILGNTLWKRGEGLQVFSGSNKYSGRTTIEGGVLRTKDGVGLPATSNLSLAGGVLESIGSTTFPRSLGSGSSGSDQVRWTGSGGFSAYGGKMTVALGGTANPTPLTWGSGYFVPVGSVLLFGSATADNQIALKNSINLAGDRKSVV
jgi:autotransporter-associated beta strand protein